MTMTRPGFELTTFLSQGGHSTTRPLSSFISWQYCSTESEAFVKQEKLFLWFKVGFLNVLGVVHHPSTGQMNINNQTSVNFLRVTFAVETRSLKGKKKHITGLTVACVRSCGCRGRPVAVKACPPSLRLTPWAGRPSPEGSAMCTEMRACAEWKNM